MTEDVPPLEPELADLLLRLVRIDAGAHETFRPVFRGGMAPMIFTSHALEDGEPEIKPGLVHGLADYALVDLEPAPNKILGPFRITPLGRRTAQAVATSASASVYRRERRGDGQPVDTSWRALEPILVAIHDRFVAAGASRELSGRDAHQGAAPDLTEAQFAASLRVLRDGGYLEYRSEVGPVVPNGIRPTQRTIERLGRWPTDDPNQLADRLLDALDVAIENASSPEDRTRLQQAREALGEVSKSAAGGMVVALGKYLTGL